MSAEFVINASGGDERHVASVSPLLLIGKDMRELIARFLLLARGSLRVGGDEMQRLGDALIRNLEALAELAELSGQDQVFVDERIDLLAMVEASGEKLRVQGLRAPAVIFESVGGTGSTVYGCSRWLSLALATLLERVSKGCHRSHSVTVRLRNMGQQITVAVGSEFQGKAAKSKRPNQNSAVPIVCEPPPFLHELDLMLCKRIIELHGGQLKLIPEVDFPEDHAPIDSLVISLPTGLPDIDRHRLACEKCPITLQTLKMAQDISYLLQADHQESEGKR